MPWIQNFSPSPRIDSYAQSPMKVSQLIDHELHTWKNSLVMDMFSPTSAQAILSTPIPSRPRPDKLLWILDSKGLFSVKSAYKEILPTPFQQTSSNVNWSKLWKTKGPKMIKMFLWRVAVNALPIRENLMSRMDIQDSAYVLCNMEWNLPLVYSLDAQQPKLFGSLLAGGLSQSN